MSFALTAFEAYPLEIKGSNVRRAEQRVVLHCTGLAADVDLDTGDDSGTFWTDALADTDSGELATIALAEFKRVVAIADKVAGVFTSEILPKAQSAAVTPGSYHLSLQDKRPNYTFFAGEGETSYTIVIDYLLLPEQYPIVSNYGITGG